MSHGRAYAHGHASQESAKRNLRDDDAKNVTRGELTLACGSSNVPFCKVGAGVML